MVNWLPMTTPINKYIPKESLEDLKEKFEYGCGRHRLTLLINSKWVVKLPRYEFGEEGYYYSFDDCHEANLREARIYKTYSERTCDQKEQFHYAKCKMINFRGRPALLMERFIIDLGFSLWKEREEYEDGENLPEWMFDWDAEQVGVFKGGEILLYDYAEG